MLTAVGLDVAKMGWKTKNSVTHAQQGAHDSAVSGTELFDCHCHENFAGVDGGQRMVARSWNFEINKLGQQQIATNYRNYFLSKSHIYSTAVSVSSCSILTEHE